MRCARRWLSSVWCSRKGGPDLKDIRAPIDDEAIALPGIVRDVARLCLAHIDALSAKIDNLKSATSGIMVQVRLP